MSSQKIDFTRRLLGLLSDPVFIRYTNILGEPNFFTIVGRSHFERWHSCFIGWLLDSNGTHLLSDYVIKRLLLLLLDDRCLKPSGQAVAALIQILPTLEFESLEVVPNENNSTEIHVGNVGRFDIYATGKLSNSDGNFQNINIVIELKIDSKIRGDQSQKYADWLIKNYPDDLNILIYLLPNLLTTPKATVGDARWFCLDYQILHDRLLLPILGHPNLNERVKPFIIQYIKNLSVRYRGIKMAITDEEKQLAITLYDKYRDVFDSIFDALQSASVIEESVSGADSTGRLYDKMAVKIDEKIFVGVDVKDLFKQVLEYLVDTNKLSNFKFPWGTSTKRYIVTNVEPPIHPSGRNFFVPVGYEGFTMEAHYSRNRAIKVLDSLCTYIQLEFELVEV
ncbi:MAG: PD-(D/E)XK nuclease family protein [Anaerolineales bacterium]|nr:PD-(D/E)XK nuclease family protein [Anaerolineales bacterium]